jgi:hypothetical protein
MRIERHRVDVGVETFADRTPPGIVHPPENAAGLNSKVYNPRPRNKDGQHIQRMSPNMRHRKTGTLYGGSDF